MSSVLIDSHSYTPGTLRPGANTAPSASGWLLQYEAELAGDSVCRAIQLRERVWAADQSPPDAGCVKVAEVAGGTSPEMAASGRQPSTATGGNSVAPSLTGGQPVLSNMPKPSEPAWPRVPLLAGQIQGVQAAEPIETVERAAAVPEAMIRSWLKPYKATVFSDEDQVRIWLRDARLDAEQTVALVERLAQLIRKNGGQLALLAINGVVVRTSSSSPLYGGGDSITRE
jgi:hypothetical protein